MIRRWTACCLAAAVGLTMLLVPALATPAYAGGAIPIAGAASCNYATGNYTLTWSITNDQTTPETVTSSDPPGVPATLPPGVTKFITSAPMSEKDLQTLDVEATYTDGTTTTPVSGTASITLHGCAKITFTSTCGEKLVSTHVVNGALGTLYVHSSSSAAPNIVTPTITVGPGQTATTQPLAADGSATITAFNGATKLTTGHYSSTGCSSGGGGSSGGGSGGGGSGGGSTGGSGGGGTVKPAAGPAAQPATNPTTAAVSTTSTEAEAPQTGGSGSSSISKLLSSPTVALLGGGALIFGGIGLIVWMIVDSVKGRKARKRRDLKTGKIRGKRPPGGMRGDDGW